MSASVKLTTQPTGDHYSLGISPCPNDTFIFDALLQQRMDYPFTVTPLLADVEDLNLRARRAELDISKLSLGTVPLVWDDYVLLHSGAALGRGCGPLLVSKEPCTVADLQAADIAIPGRLTTANMLLSLHGAFAGKRQEMVFNAVMPAVASGHVPAGVIIHEGRFTYAQHGLHLVLDLGQWWESMTSLPLPLGVIAARRCLGKERIMQIDAAVRQSLEYAWAQPQASAAFIRQHAQEMDPTVCSQHIATFVTSYSADLGAEGKQAIRRLLAEGARLQGIDRAAALPLFVGEL